MYFDSLVVYEKYLLELVCVFIELKVFLEVGYNCVLFIYEKSWLI